MDEAPEEFGPVEIDPKDLPDEAPILDGDATQHMLMSYLSSSKEIWVRCAPVLTEEYFDKEYADVLTTIREFETANATLPSKQVIHADTGIMLEKPDDADDPKITQAICDRVEEFCRHQAALNFLDQSFDIIQEDRTRGTMSGLVSEMDRIASISVRQDLGYEVHEAVEELLQKAQGQDALPTDFQFLDDALNGGVTIPSFNLVSAASGQGKSIKLQNLAINYSRQGNNVVYITLELPEFMLEKRFAAMMTGTGINAIYENFETVVRKMKRMGDQYGRIQVKRMKMTGTTVADIRAYVNELASSTGQEWNHIMIDYMDLMKPMRPGIRLSEIHQKDQAVSEEIYEWTHEPGANKVIWSASQQTKGAKDEKDARQSAVAGGVGKVNTCDNLIILKRSLEDIQDERCIGFIEKGRNGGQGKRVPFHWHADTQRMTNPDEMKDLYDELNSPGAREREDSKSKIRGDPVMQAKMADSAARERRGSTIADRIQKISKRKEA